MPAHSPYSPQVLSWLARLGATLPFAQAAALLSELTGIPVSASTLRRQTEALGATAVAVAEAEVARLEREMPRPPTAPARLVLEADGAQVPLVRGEWAEMKQVSVGEPVAARGPAGATRLSAVSYFARLDDAETFGRQALGELHRRGVETARAVAAVQDGAPWLQGFIELHRPDAVRILDWPHAVEHLRQLLETLFGADPPRCQRLLERLRRGLWEAGPEPLLGVLAGWERAAPERRLRPDQPSLATQVAYFRERRAQLDYPAFRAAGWPVGSGAVESGHKQVMQARMKRAGMRWARPQVNPLLALRTLECNRRWPSAGDALLRAHRQRRTAQRRQRQHARRLACRLAGQLATPSPTPPPTPQLAPPTGRVLPRLLQPAAPMRHPWRRYGAPLSVKS